MSHRDIDVSGGMEELVGLRVRLRRVVERDIPELSKWDEDEEIVRWLGKSQEEPSLRRRRRLHATSHARTLAIELRDGVLLGEVDIQDISWRRREAELAICIGRRDMWDRGLGEDAVRTLVGGLFRHTSLVRLFMRVDADNARARRCYEKVGFVTRGRLRQRGEDGAQRTMLFMTIEKEDMETA